MLRREKCSLVDSAARKSRIDMECSNNDSVSKFARFPFKAGVKKSGLKACIDKWSNA